MGEIQKIKNILLHEQGHFDISELFARKFRQEVRVKRLKENSEIIVLYGKLMNDKKLYNLMYDTETDFSNNLKKQVYWRRKITHEIHLLDAYKN